MSAVRMRLLRGSGTTEAFVRNWRDGRTVGANRFRLESRRWDTPRLSCTARGAPTRREGILGKYDWEDERVFSQSVRAEIKKGPDFAGRFAILTWSCGSWCANATIADIRTGKTYETPFVGIVGCSEVTGDFDTLQRKADSSLLIARGRLEMAVGDNFDDGPCGTYYFQWRLNHLRLIGSDITAKEPKSK
jgi:hypothetical protein